MTNTEPHYAMLVSELRSAQGDGSDWTEDLFSRAADAIEMLHDIYPERAGHIWSDGCSFGAMHGYSDIHNPYRSASRTIIEVSDDRPKR